MASRSRAPRRVPGLSPTAREREVLALVASGLSNGEVAGRLSMSVSTATTHAARAMTKLGARDRAQLAVIACESGSSGPAGRWVGPKGSGGCRRMLPMLEVLPSVMR